MPSNKSDTLRALESAYECSRIELLGDMSTEMFSQSEIKSNCEIGTVQSISSTKPEISSFELILLLLAAREFAIRSLLCRLGLKFL